jgi:hypothetical protein
MSVFCLSVHAGYACAHSGACCTAGWNIPVEPALQLLLGADILLPDKSGACRFFDPASSLCRVHRDRGPGSLPASCHHFPRRALIDDRGTFVALSLFCPTAARQLVDDDGPLAIVADPPAFPPGRGYDGLDARGEWPPLVRPDLLFDGNSYSRWERAIVAILAREHTVEAALMSIATAAERLRAWTPENGPFANWVDRVLECDRPADPQALSIYTRFFDDDAYERVRGMVPPELHVHLTRRTSHCAEPCAPSFEAAARRYLAAKAFASWTAYQGRGVRTLVAELVMSAHVLRTEAAQACLATGGRLNRQSLIEAVRASDHLLMHQVDRITLMKWLGRAEE